jgi:peroxiredoxin/cold shock CspA family protein
MTTHLQVDDLFPDFELPDHTGRLRRLSGFTRPGIFDEYAGFTDGYPVIVIFYRGFFCPRDQQQMRLLVGFQDELRVNFCKLVVVGVQPPLVHAAFRAGLGADWTFFADTERMLIRQVNVLDATEGEYADTALPFTFVLRPDLSIHRIYNGWYFVGRPTLEELRRDLREVMARQAYYPYEAWTTPEIQQIRVPQSRWAEGATLPDPDGATLASGVVISFDLRSGNGFIRMDETGERVFFNFTAIPGEGYRTISAETRVRFEPVETPRGLAARFVQPVK